MTRTKRTNRILRKHVRLVCDRCRRPVNWSRVEAGWKGCCPGAHYPRQEHRRPWKKAL